MPLNDGTRLRLYQSDKFIDHLARIKRLRGKALVEENGYSLVKINNAAYKPFNSRPLGDY